MKNVEGDVRGRDGFAKNLVFLSPKMLPMDDAKRNRVDNGV